MATRGEGQQAVRPGFLILGGVALAGVVVFLLINVVFGGDGEEPVITPQPQADGVATPAPAAPEATPSPSPEEIEVFEIFEGRDPFRPLVFEQPTDPDGGPEPDGIQPTPVPNGGPVPTPAPTPPPRRSGVQVEVLSVADDSSSTTVRVGSEVFENATEGQTLDSGVSIVSIEDPCVDFRRDGNSFTLCEGEQVLK